MDARLPTHLEVGALIRQVNAAGGFGTVIHKGDANAGTILIVLTENGTNPRIYERMPAIDGSRNWHLRQTQDADKQRETEEYLAARSAQDPDLWIVELDIAHGERFIGIQSPAA